eukprot:TRINITY_DN989_c0_g1_i1.p1 TRINITY_DN989_c0_g1~~TRINITY_DN989_c0_g1_i1.p1  ORF type:complete len:104 (+),score=27.28 TRINITY_DN989_c0_g1_i1:35-346(+)
MGDEEPETIKLISEDGHVFVIDRRAGMLSGTIKAMIGGPGGFSFTENQKGEIHFREIRGAVLEKVCEYFYYKLKYENTPDHPEFPLDPEIALEVLMAANFLDT